MICTVPVDVTVSDPKRILSPAAAPRVISVAFKLAFPRTFKEPFALSVICPLFPATCAVRFPLTVKFPPKFMDDCDATVASFSSVAVDSMVVELTF